MVVWKCNVCGYVHDGEEAPEQCPKCGAPKEEFVEQKGEAGEKIVKSRITNDIHMDMRILLAQIEELAEEGIEENLDPPCVAIFSRAKKDAHELAGMIKAELAGHMTKGKWG